MSKIEVLRQALRDILAQHQADGTLPTSARFLYYELVAVNVVSKHATGARRADQGVIDALKSLRDRREIPWDWIVDETRSLEDHTGFPSIAIGVDAYLNTIRIDPWSGAAPLILTESRSLAGALRNLAREYAVKITATNGQVGGFLHTDVAPALGDEARVLYLGDFDLAGADIEANTRRVLERNRNRDWERLALTREQVRLYSLPVITKSDGRFANGGTHDAVETEALSQLLIVQIVRDRLDELLPAPLADFAAAEATERERLRALLGGAD
jgi:hypothetical protein